MRKFAMAAMICMLGASISFAQQEPMTQEEKNLEILSKKLVRMKREMDKFVKDMSVAYQEEGSSFSGSYGSDVRVDVVDNVKEFIVRADLPGMDKDKIVVTLDNNKVLKISGSREAVKAQTGPSVVKQERMEGKFERVVELPAECKSDGIKASYKNGVLEITIPKKEPAKKETIKVSVQ